MEAAQRDQGFEPDARIGMIEVGEHGPTLRGVAVVFPLAHETEGVSAEQGVFVLERGQQERLIEVAEVVQRPEGVQPCVGRS